MLTKIIYNIVFKSCRFAFSVLLCYTALGTVRKLKRFFNFLGNIAYFGMILWELVELLALPVLFVVIGIVNDLSWKFYVITIGGYFLLIILIQIICHFVFKALEKEYESFFDRLFTNISKAFSRNNEN